MRSIAISLLTLLGLAGPALAAGRPMTVDDLLAVQTVSDPHVSPDGKEVVYVVSEVDREANRSDSDLWRVAVAGGEPRRLTTAPGADHHPRWSPDGKTIAFLSDRGGSSQVWLLPVDGGEARPLTTLPIDVEGPIWSPKGDRIAFVAQVYPGTSPKETARQDKEKAEAPTQVRTFDHLMVRHWTTWDSGKRSHLFIADAVTGEAKDLTPELVGNTPPAPFGGSSDYAFSPEGDELAFTAEPATDRAWSTNTDIWTVPASGGPAKNLTGANLAADAQPSYSPDGRLMAWVTQAREGFEADQWVLTVRDRKTGRVDHITRALDRPVVSYDWAAPPGDGEGAAAIVAVVDDQGTEPIIRIELSRGENGTITPGEIEKIVTGAANGSVCVVTGDGRTVVFTRSTANRPAEVFRSEADASDPLQLTHHNDPLIAGLDLAEAEPFRFAGAEGDEVGGLLVRPPGFDPGEKYPVLFLIHGGPQGAWHDEWHARWNYALFAAPGYAIVAINPRGSTGFGQTFTDQISKDWTGRVYDDLMKGLDHALMTYPFLDADRVAAAGGSYGGFMVNWIAGHTDRFKALVSHAGVFDLTSMYGTTEELWFPEWEFGGPPWDDLPIYREQSPSRFVQAFVTPTLVIHGALDFRVPDAQGFGMFTSLQRRGVPSRLVYFPDEGHWVLKPANRVAWWREVHDWLERYLSPGGG